MESKYTPKYKDEIFSLIDKFNLKINIQDINKNTANTVTLSGYFYISIIELIKGAYCLIESRNINAFQILMRSTYEHCIDMHYISLSKSPDINNLFNKYHKLLLYWERKNIEHYKEMVPKVMDDYWDYILKYLVEDKVDKIKPKNKLITAKQIDDTLINHFKKHWSGNHIKAIIEKIEQLLLKYDSSRIKEKLTPLQQRFYFFFSTYSNYTHPTPYSVFPHFGAIDNLYETKYSHNDETMEDSETGLFLALDYTVRAYCDAYEYSAGKMLYDYFNSIFDETNMLSKWFYDQS